MMFLFAGTIKRKPSMKPSLPLTSITRQLKEVGENRDEVDMSVSPVSETNTGKNCATILVLLSFNINSLLLGTLTRRHSRRKSSNSTDDSSNSGTLKRQHSYKTRGSLESMGARSGNSTPLCSTPVRDRGSPFGERERSSPFGDRERASPFTERPPSTIRSPVVPTVAEMPSCMVSVLNSLRINCKRKLIRILKCNKISTPLILT